MAHVLLIDDDPDIRSHIREMLEDAGHTVTEATDGRSGLRIFRDMNPALAMVDLFMPEKDGIETIREMRALHPEAKIIAISGGGRYGVTDLLEGVTSLGADAALAKPFRAAALHQVVEQVFRRGYRARTTAAGH